MKTLFAAIVLIVSQSVLATDSQSTLSEKQTTAPKVIAYQVTISEWLPQNSQTNKHLYIADKNASISIQQESKGSRVEFKFDGKASRDLLDITADQSAGQKMKAALIAVR